MKTENKISVHNLIELLKQNLVIDHIVKKNQKVSKQLIAEVDRLTQMMFGIAVTQGGENREQLESELYEERRIMNAAQAAYHKGDIKAFEDAMAKYKQVYARNAQRRGCDVPEGYWDDDRTDGEFGTGSGGIHLDQL